MRKILAYVVMSLCLQFLVLTARAEDKVYTVGVVPQFEVSRLHAIWRPILDELEVKTGLKFRLQGSPTIAEFEVEFPKGMFDFAYMNPYHLIIANDKAGYIPLARDHGAQLFGVLVTAKNSGLTSPSQLDGKTIAFPSPNALGASLQMRQELVDKFGVKFKPVYVKTHDSVYLNVLIGEVSAGGGVQKTLNQQKQSYINNLQVIHTTQKVAPHPFVVLPTVDASVRERVKSALLDMGETEKGKKLLSLVPIKKIGPAVMKDYEPLRAMKLERFYGNPPPLQGSQK